MRSRILSTQISIILKYMYENYNISYGWNAVNDNKRWSQNIIIFMLRHVPEVMSGVTVIMHVERQKSRSFNAPTRLYTWNSCRHIEKFLLQDFHIWFHTWHWQSWRVNKLVLGRLWRWYSTSHCCSSAALFETFLHVVRHFFTGLIHPKRNS